jgi:cadmium resistance transport/sequestration family protein
MLAALFSSLIAFVATNLDDLVILMLFFVQVNARFQVRHIVIGQYLGFGALVLASLPGFFGGMLISKPLIGLLGGLPIAVGVLKLLHADQDEEPVQAVSVEPQRPVIAGMLNPQIFQVAAVTFANGGDNIGIYVPLFARSSWASLGITLGTFFLMVGLWCWCAYWLSRHRAIAPLLSRYSHHIVPWVLIGLGIYILVENQSWTLWRGVSAWFR